MALPNWAKAPAVERKIELPPTEAAAVEVLDVDRFIVPDDEQCLYFDPLDEVAIFAETTIVDEKEHVVEYRYPLRDVWPPLTSDEIWQLLPIPMNRRHLAEQVRKLRPLPIRS